MVIFLTGEKQVGKSYAIRKFLNMHRGLKLGGYFTVHDTEEIIMKPAGNPQSDGFLVGIKKLKGYPEVFETDGLAILKASYDADLIILDEVGWMESDAERFSEEIQNIIKSGKNVLGVLRKDLDTPLSQFIYKNAEVIEVTESDRNSVPKLLEKRFNNEI